MRLLLVEDDTMIGEVVLDLLRAEHYAVDWVKDGEMADTALMQSQNYDLVVLDLGLPDMQGVDVIRGLRGWTNIPIIVLSGRVDSRDKVDALDAGADDYITKPFGVDELLARIRAVTRRAHPTGETASVVIVGRHTVDLAARAITGGDTETRLTPTEWQLLEHLLRNPGKLLSQRSLLQDVWGPQYGSETHYLRQYMARLRRKLEADPARPQHLLTEPGMGYRFRP